MKLTIKSMSQAVLAVLFAVVLASSLLVGMAKAEEMESTEPTTPTESTTPTMMTAPTMTIMSTMTTLPTISPEMLKEFPPCQPGQSELILCNPNSKK